MFAVVDIVVECCCVFVAQERNETAGVSLSNELQLSSCRSCSLLLLLCLLNELQSSLVDYYCYGVIVKSKKGDEDMVVGGENEEERIRTKWRQKAKGKNENK